MKPIKYIPNQPSKIALVGEAPGCISGDSLIEVAYRDKSVYPNGIPIRDLVEQKDFKVYSYDIYDKKLVLGTVKRVWSVGVKPVYKVSYEWYFNTSTKPIIKTNSIKVTDNHPFLLTNVYQTYHKYSNIKEQNLVGMSVQPFYRRENGGYCHIGVKSDEMYREGRFLLSCKEGRRLEDDEQVHHINTNKLDDSYDNLELKLISDHTAHHMTTNNPMHNQIHRDTHKLMVQTESYKLGQRDGRLEYLSNPVNYEKCVLKNRELGPQISSTLKEKYKDPTFYFNYLLNRQKLFNKPDSWVICKFKSKFPTIPIPEKLNHRIKSIVFCGHEEVFDMEVEKYHNFAVNDIFVHNSQEVEMLQPFVGPEGRYFTNLLKQAGLNRYSCYITNTVHTQPYRNDYSTLKQSDLDFGREELIHDLTEWKTQGLTTVIAIGAKALELLTGKTGIYRYRGTALPCTLVPGLKVYSTVHPGSIIRGEGKYEPIFILDVKKAIADSESPETTYPYRNITIIQDETHALLELGLVTEIQTPVVIDIETAGPKMTAFGWAISPTQAYVLTSPMLRNFNVLHAIGRFASSSTPKIFHNALFDVFHGAYYYQILYKNIFFDTMIAQHTAYPTLPKSLGFCSSIYTNEPYWKEEGREAMDDLKRGIMSWEKLYNYNGKDCCLTYEIYLALVEELKDWGVEKVFADRMALLPACLYAQMRGLLLDVEECANFAQRNEQAIVNLEQIKEAILGDINVRSSKQLIELIYNQWGMPVHKKQGKVTTEEKKLRMLLRYPTPYSASLGLILELKERYKMRDFYTIKTDKDGRVRCSMKITGTYTGRLATSASITGSGANLQNIPKEVRVIYKADPGKIMCQCDLSQSEARIVAALCEDEPWLKAFDEKDLHTEVASFLYGIPVEKVEKKTHRMTAKRVAHGTHYGMGYMLLSEILECPPKEAKHLREKYLEYRSNLKKWHSKVKQQIREKRFIRTCFGVIIQFFGPLGNVDDDEGAIGKIMREAVAAEPQSTSVSYINQGIVKCFNEIPEFDFLLQVHDSILFQLPDDVETIKRVFHKVKELIEVPITINGINFVIPLNFEIGYNWGTMTELKNIEEVDSVHPKLSSKD